MKIFYLFIFCFGFAYSQNQVLDSLQTVLKTGKEDAKKVATLHRLNNELINHGKYNEALRLLDEEYKLAEKLNLQREIIESLIAFGLAYNHLSDFKKAMEYYEKALIIATKNNDVNPIGLIHLNIGNVYFDKGEFPKTLEHYFLALKFMTQAKSKGGIAKAQANIGIIYAQQKEFKKALEMFLESEKNAGEIGDKETVSISTDNQGVIYKQTGHPDKALELYNRGYKFYEESGNKKMMAISLSNIGGVYYDEGNLQKSLEADLKALALRVEIKDEYSEALSLGNIAGTYLDLKKYDDAIVFCKKSLALASKLGSLNTLAGSNQMLSLIYQAKKQPKEALECYKRYISARDNIFNEDNTKKTVRLEMQFDFDKKEAASKLEQEKKEAISLAESKKQKIIIWSVCGILILVIAFAIFAYRSFLEKQKANIAIIKQKEIIEEKQKEILDSIRYAKKIQTALLPTEKYIGRNLDKFW